MANVVITREAYAQALDEIVQENGRDFVYEDEYGVTRGVCMYVHTKNLDAPQPGCLHGRVLARLGVTLDELSDYEGHGIDVILRDAMAVEDDGLASAAREAQCEQDSGESWGVAQDVFHKVLSIQGFTTWGV